MKRKRHTPEQIIRKLREAGVVCVERQTRQAEREDAEALDGFRADARQFAHEAPQTGP